MAKNNNLTDFLTDTANHIRSKAGINDTTKINPQDFSGLIGTMPMLAQPGASGSRYRKRTWHYTDGGSLIDINPLYDVEDTQKFFADGTPTCIITIVTITLHTLAESGNQSSNDGGYDLKVGVNFSEVVPVLSGNFNDLTERKVIKFAYSDIIFPSPNGNNTVTYSFEFGPDSSTGFTVDMDFEWQQLIMPISNARFSAATCKALVESGV